MRFYIRSQAYGQHLGSLGVGYLWIAKNIYKIFKSKKNDENLPRLLPRMEDLEKMIG